MCTVLDALHKTRATVLSTMHRLLKSEVTLVAFLVDSHGTVKPVVPPVELDRAAREHEAVAALVVGNIERTEQFCAAEVSWTYPRKGESETSVFVLDREDDGMLEWPEEPSPPLSLAAWLVQAA